MSTFRDEQEVYTYLGGIFEEAFAHEEVGPKLENAGLRLRVDYTDPDAVMWVNMASHEILTGEEADAADWDVALGMSADDGHVFWMGNLNFTVAMTKGRIRTKGSVTELLKLLPVAKPLFATYRELLEKHDRTDLLAIEQ